MNGPDGPPVGDRMVRAVHAVRAKRHGRGQTVRAIERPDARHALFAVGIPKKGESLTPRRSSRDAGDGSEARKAFQLKRDAEAATRRSRRPPASPLMYTALCTSMGVEMQFAKWGDHLAVRLPASVVEALDLKPGDKVHIHVRGERAFAVEKAPRARELLARLRKYRGRLPLDFKFDRLDANERE
jgi:antitoxin MazE